MLLHKLVQTEVQKPPFKITSQIKYLGIQLTSNLKDLVALNFTPLLKNFEDDLSRWNKLPLSLIGCIAAIKINILPKLIYLFQMTPVTSPKKWFNKLDSLITSFYWKQKKPRIKLSTLQHTKSLGGLEAPNFHLYLISTQLQSIRQQTPIPQHV